MKVEHRMFLQGILCEKILNYEEVKDLYEKSLRHGIVAKPR